MNSFGCALSVRWAYRSASESTLDGCALTSDLSHFSRFPHRGASGTSARTVSTRCCRNGRCQYAARCCTTTARAHGARTLNSSRLRPRTLMPHPSWYTKYTSSRGVDHAPKPDITPSLCQALITLSRSARSPEGAPVAVSAAAVLDSSPAASPPPPPVPLAGQNDTCQFAEAAASAPVAPSTVPSPMGKKMRHSHPIVACLERAREHVPTRRWIVRASQQTII